MARLRISDKNLQTHLDAHALWLKDRDAEGACRLHLSQKILGRGLRGVDLRWAYLSRCTIADVCRVNFRGARVHNCNVGPAAFADFRGANLALTKFSDANAADFRDSHVSGSGFVGCDLTDAKGLIPLGQTEYGYAVMGVWRHRRWRIVAGCRDFTLRQARHHWGRENYHTPRHASRILASIDWIETQHPIPPKRSTQ